MVAGLVVRDTYGDDDLVSIVLYICIHTNGVLQQFFIHSAGHTVAEDGLRVAYETTFIQTRKIICPSGRHVAVLTCLAGYRIAVGAIQPLSERVVNYRIPEDTEVTRCTVLTLFL